MSDNSQYRKLVKNYSFTQTNMIDSLLQSFVRFLDMYKDNIINMNEKQKEILRAILNEYIAIIGNKENEKKILDVCCGSKMFWFDKDNKNTIFMDNRELEDILCDGRKLKIKPDIVADFREIPFENNSFNLVVFDPPHLLKIGENSYMAKKYGKLTDNWRQDIKQGFNECMRVLKQNGILVFKWNEQQIKLREILEIINYKPLFGNRRDKTHWLVFFKEEK